MLIIRPSQRLTNQGVRIRMKPASAMSSIWLTRRTSSIARSNASRSLSKARWSTVAVAMPEPRARARPAASGLFESTSAISAG